MLEAFEWNNLPALSSQKYIKGLLCIVHCIKKYNFKN
jgi:hypothetical protein